MDEELNYTDPITIHLYVSTNDVAIKNLMNDFSSKYPPDLVTEKDSSKLWVWNSLDWMKCYLDFNKLEDTVGLWPEDCYYWIDYDDEMSEVNQQGGQNTFKLKVTRTVEFEA